MKHTLHDLIGNISVDEWQSVLLNAVDTPDPTFPKFTHIARLGSANLKEGIKEAFKLYRIARPHLDDCVGKNKVYMDFGCGVGRVLRTYIRDFPPENMIGLDVTEEFIDICNRDFGDGFRFHHIATRPPCPLPDQSVDVITAYSVFSHFSAIQATRWLDEFNRIARPGAIIVLTTYSRSHINFIYDAPLETVPPNKLAQREPFNEMGGRDEIFRMLGLGEMVFIQKGAVFGRYDYGDAYVGEEFVRRIWGRIFEVIEIVDDYNRLEQMAVVLRKSK